MNAVTLDTAALAAVTDNDAAFEKKIFSLFYQTAERCLHAMSEAAKNNDRQAWRTAAHELKGAAAGICAGELTYLCLSAETMFQPSEIHALAAAYARLKEAIESRTHKAQTQG